MLCRWSALLPAVAAALALFAVACGGGSPEDARDRRGPVVVGEIDPCSLITMDDAREILQEEELEFRRGEDLPWKSCDYSTPFAADRSKLLHFGVRGGVDGQAFAAEKEEASREAAAGVRDVRGVGDEAFTDAGALWVRWGDVEFLIAAMVRPLSLPYVDEELERALEVNKEVARRAMERLE